MRIVVTIKQVPETSSVRMDPETGTMVRSGTDTVVNPLDLYAIEAALRLRERYGGSITALSMGPPQAEKAVREAIAMGCDDGILLSDPAFGGSDTWATSYTLSAAIGTMGTVDLVIAGERATDGDTAQVGPGIAAWMNLPLATYVAHIPEVDGDRITVERLVEEGYQIVELPTPTVLTVVKEIAPPRLPTLAGKRRARLAEIPVIGAAALTLDRNKLGLRGSPTKVVQIATPTVTRGGTIVDANEGNLEEVIDQLVSFLESREII